MKKTTLVVLLSVIASACNKSAGAAESAVGTISLLGRTYHLGSYNQKSKPTWEFVTGDETVNNWTTLVTVIERADAHTRPELDQLSEGIMANYKSHGGQILMAKTFPAAAGGAYNYIASAFEEPAKNRFELNFVKMGLGAKNAYVVVYGVRISDPKDYVRKGKDFLNQRSSEIGIALEKLVLPDLATLPRKEF